MSRQGSIRTLITYLLVTLKTVNRYEYFILLNISINIDVDEHYRTA